MIAQRYKDMLSGKSVIRQISEWSTARGTEIGYENVFDYSLGNPSVPCPEHFTKTCIDLLQTKEPVTLHGYSPTLTIPAVRKAVAESLNRRFGMDYTAEYNAMHQLYENPDEVSLAQWGIDYVLFDSYVFSNIQNADESWYAARYPLWYENGGSRIYKING